MATERGNQTSSTAEAMIGTPINPEMQLLLDALPFYVMLIDAEHRILLANKAVHETLRILATIT
jgi:hypothetical protein